MSTSRAGFGEIARRERKSCARRFGCILSASGFSGTGSARAFGLMGPFPVARATAKVPTCERCGKACAADTSRRESQFTNGRQRAALSGADHAHAAAGRVRLCAVQFVGKRDRAQQGSLLLGVASDARHDPHGVTELAAVASVLSTFLGRADAASGEEGRAREDRAGGHA